MARGAFIVFEGLDGAGISTQARLFHERLVSAGVPCNRSAEPTTGPIGALLHQYLTHRQNFDPLTLAALFAADRLDHLFNATNGIAQRLYSGITEISERYLFSSLAYQGVAADMDWLVAVNKKAILPDVVVFLDIDPKASYERISKRQTSDEIFESLAELEKVALNFVLALRRFEKRLSVVRVDASGDPQEIGDSVWEAVNELDVIAREGVLPLWERRPSSAPGLRSVNGVDE